MQAHLREIEVDLRGRGLRGELLGATSLGGVMPMADVAARPIYTVRSGPALAPVAGLGLRRARSSQGDVIVCDAGGTSFDVSLVRDGDSSLTRETWLGGAFAGHITGLSVGRRALASARAAARSHGSTRAVCCASGPRARAPIPAPPATGAAATSRPSPTRPRCSATSTRRLPRWARCSSTRRAPAAIVQLADALGLGPRTTRAARSSTVANEHMIAAIQEITVNEGIDPREAVVAGGGAAGLDRRRSRASSAAARADPARAPARSARRRPALRHRRRVPGVAVRDTRAFDFDAVNEALAVDRTRSEVGRGSSSAGVGRGALELLVEARYAHRCGSSRSRSSAPFADRDDVAALVERLPRSCTSASSRSPSPGSTSSAYWKARLRDARAGDRRARRPRRRSARRRSTRTREAYFRGQRLAQDAVSAAARSPPGRRSHGPAIVEEPTTTVVVPPGAELRP